MAALQVDRRRGDLFNYLIFLRVTPILPNIFINIASPVVDVPLRPFALGVLNIQSGCTALYEIIFLSIHEGFTCHLNAEWLCICT